MKRFLLGIWLLLLGFTASCSVSSESETVPVTIAITGTCGLKFSGSYEDINGVVSVNGTIPEWYSLKIKKEIICTLEKQEEDGMLQVSIIVSGRVIKTESLNNKAGVITINMILPDIKKSS